MTEKLHKDIAMCLSYGEDLAVSLQLAHGQATQDAPIADMVLLDLIDRQRDINKRLAILLERAGATMKLQSTPR